MIKLGVPHTGLPVELDIVNTREDEAFAMAAGIAIAGGDARVYMQDDGFLNAINVAATLIAPYQIPEIMFTVHWRNDNLPHHIYATQIGWELWSKHTNPAWKI